MALLAAGAVGGCSLAFPLPGLFAEPETTQSLPARDETKPAAAPPEAVATSRASALGRALHPQGEGGRADWADPTSRARGHVAALGSPFVSGADICRRFENVTLGRGVAPSKVERGVACRESGNTWRVRR